ncbi:hypothetical protein, partial [Flavobacterium sp.]
MHRKKLQHIKLASSQKPGNQKVVTSSAVEMPGQEDFTTAEGIAIKQEYSADDIENLEHVAFGAGFAPNLRGPY